MTDPVVFPASPAALSGDGGEAAAEPLLPPAHRLVRTLDAALRHILEIREFSARPDCLLRISLGRADRDMRLADGTRLSRGDPVVDLHLWNEQLPAPAGSTLARAIVLRRRMLSSLSELAGHLEASPAMAGVAAVRGRILCLEAGQMEVLRRLAAAAGFESFDIGSGGNLGRKLHDFLENFLIWALAWTFNPNAARGKGLRQPRCELWISHAGLAARYARRPVWPAAAGRCGTEGSAGALKRRQGR